MQRDLEENVRLMAEAAKKASFSLANLSSESKRDILYAMADALCSKKEIIIKENQKDCQNATENGKDSAFLDRLFLDEQRVVKTAGCLREIAELEDPVGSVEFLQRRPNGMLLGKMRVPIGVICIIYEARPNVTADCIGLCLKSGNAIVLRGGSDSIHSNIAIANVLSDVLQSFKLDTRSVQYIPFAEREAVDVILTQCQDYIDVVIPRGGEELIRKVVALSKIPVIKHYKGVCHIYVDSDANLEMATELAFNAKVQRPAVCNAMETLLVHKDIASSFLPKLISLYQKTKVTVRGCPQTVKLVSGIETASDDDWREEYLDLTLSVKIVDGIDDAINHINTYGSQHTDAIITEDYQKGWLFLRHVDSSSVFVNVSTRLSDGNQYGLGAEMGISTDKIHARGPMGVRDLTIHKYIVLGNGQIRE